MRQRMIRAGLVGILGLALCWGWAGQAGAAPTWSFELIPAGPVTANPGDTIDFDMKITALTDAAVSFTPLDFVDSGFTTDIEGDVGIVDSFFDVFFDLTMPISGSRSASVYHNETAVHLEAVPNIGEWPPYGTEYRAEPEAPADSYCSPSAAPPGPGGHSAEHRRTQRRTL